MNIIIRIGQLADDDPAVRSQAVRDLGSLGDPEAIPHLIESLATERDKTIRREIVTALSALDPRSASVDVQIAIILGDRDSVSADKAIDRLVAANHPRVLEALKARLNLEAGIGLPVRDDYDVNHALNGLLDQTKYTKIGEALILLAETVEDNEVRERSMRALKALGDLESAVRSIKETREGKTNELSTSAISLMPNFEPAVIQPVEPVLPPTIQMEELQTVSMVSEPSAPETPRIRSFLDPPEEAEKLLATLQDDEADWEDRQAAAQGLAEYNHSQVIEALIERLDPASNDRDGDVDVRQSIAETLAKLGAINAASVIARAYLNAEENDEANNLIGTLSFGQDQAEQVFIEALRDTDTGTRQRGVQGLFDLGSTRAAELVAEMVDEERDDDVRDIIFTQLADQNDVAKNVKVQCALLQCTEDLARGDDAYEMRHGAAKNLGAIGDKQAIEPLLKRLKDEDDEDVILAIIDSLFLLDAENLADPIANTLGQLDDDHYDEALQKVAESNQAMAILATMAEDQSCDTRQAAAKGLGMCKDKDEEVIDLLVAMIEDENDDDVLKEIYSSLDSLDRSTPNNLKINIALLACEVDTDDNEAVDIRSAAAATLGQISGNEAVDALLTRIKVDDRGNPVEEEDAVRQAVVEALIELAPPQAAEALATLLEDESDSDITEAIEEYLGENADPATLRKVLFRKLEADDSDDRAEAAEKLGELVDDEEVIEKLLGRIGDEDEDGVFAAIYGSLRKLDGSGTNIEIQIALLKCNVDVGQTNDWGIRRDAVIALAKIGSDRAEAALIDVLESNDDDNGDEDVIRQVIRSLGEMKADGAAAAIVSYAENTSGCEDDTIVAAFEVVKAIGDKDQLTSLLLTIDSEYSIDSDSIDVIEELTNAGGEGAVDRIVELFSECDDSDDAIKYAKALGNIGTKSLISTLEAQLVDDKWEDDTEVKKAIRAAIAKINRRIGDE